MNAPDRVAKIRSILDARRPMADRANKTEGILNRIDNQLRSFREFVPGYAKRLDADAASRITALLPEIEENLGKIAQEKGKLALLSGRFTRPTLNIGVVGRAGQGKSNFLQKLTGLTAKEIPSASGSRHCTGAPSTIVNRDSQETYAEIKFHTEKSFLETVIAPFFRGLKLGAAPYTLEEFKAVKLPNPASEEARTVYSTTQVEYLKKLVSRQDNLKYYSLLLNGEKQRIAKDEIQSFVAQQDNQKNPFTNWFAVEMATIYCTFPHADLGAIAVADTPGLGDFLSGAEDRLVETVGRNLDVVIFVRLPPSVRAIIDPADTDLHGLIARAIPDLPVSDWSYFVINTYPDKKPDVHEFEIVLKESAIRTRQVFRVDVDSDSEVSGCLDEILNDCAGNLASLDNRLLERQSAGIKALASSIVAFAEKAASALPKATVVAPGNALLFKLFSSAWQNLAVKLHESIKSCRVKRGEPSVEFLAAMKSVFEKLDQGPNLPSPDDIRIQSAPITLMKWHADKLGELRVNISNTFEELDSCLDSSFDILREQLLSALTSEDGGKLGSPDAQSGTKSPWKWHEILDRWQGHDGAEIMSRAFNKLLTARLSFRGFIQPKVRQHLDVLDPDSPAASLFGYEMGDTAEQSKENLELAWKKACYDCKTAMGKLAFEPAMARFATAEDFKDAVLHTGGERNAQHLWTSFYKENRADIWPKQFEQLEKDTHLRKEWENAVCALRDAANFLAGAV